MKISRRDFVAGAAAATASLPLAAEAQPHPKSDWIDVHTHIIGGPKRAFGEATSIALKEMDKYGLKKAVIFPPPFGEKVPMLYDIPDYRPFALQHRDRFGFLGGGGYLNPILQHTKANAVTPAVRKQFVDAAERMVEAGAAGFGEIALLHFSLVPNQQFEEQSPEHPLMLALMEVAGKHGLVIDLHMDAIPGSDTVPKPSWLKSTKNPNTLKGNIPSFERMLAHNRNCKIVWAHGGSDFSGHMTAELISRLMDAHSNLYMSLRPLPPGANKLPFGLELRNAIMTAPQTFEPQWRTLLDRHSDRFVMGADAFFLASYIPEGVPLRTLSQGNKPRIGSAAHLLNNLPPPLARKIGTDNAVRLYKL